MVNAKPTLGYPSRTDAALALEGQGMPIREIAARMGVTTGTVHALLNSGARRGTSQFKRHGARQRPDHRTVVFEVETLSALALHAERRGISTNALVRRLVECAVDADLVDAILDDHDEATAGQEEGP